jgi:hypothetical protein
MSPEPRWLASFNLRKGMKDRSHYVLEAADPKTDMVRWWDYNVRHVRRLECRVERREHDYLTMMVEELPRCDDPSGLMIGRYVHLDTKDPAGTQPAAVVLAHLDLAINVYEGNRRKERWDARLADGKVPDASFRTHLFRVEAVPLARVFDYCRLFFRSRALISFRVGGGLRSLATHLKRQGIMYTVVAREAFVGAIPNTFNSVIQSVLDSGNTSAKGISDAIGSSHELLAAINLGLDRAKQQGVDDPSIIAQIIRASIGKAFAAPTENLMF